MLYRKYKYLFTWLFFIIITFGFAVVIVWKGRLFADYLFLVLANTGRLFSFLLGGIFVAGAVVIVNRYFFFAIHLLWSRRLFLYGDNNPDKDDSLNVFCVFRNKAREFRAISEEGVYTEDITDHARKTALSDSLNSQEIDWGRPWLEYLGTTAPTIGLIGTLVGLMNSFIELGSGGKLANVLKGLALSMTTSLIGAAISVIFLSCAWLLGRLRKSFDEQLEIISSDLQKGDI
jgi:biopolymer transport protein ExbB/TolQ